jgi:hypothetical protein
VHPSPRQAGRADNWHAGQRKPIDPAALRAVTSRMPKRGNGAGKLVRSLRDEARY